MKKMIMPNVKALVVDDNLTNLKVVKALLATFQIQTDTVSSGKESLEKVKNQEYDIIFIDYKMPDMNGIETLNNMKQLQKMKEHPIPVVALSGNEEANVREVFVQCGFQDYLTKPMKLSQIEELLLRFIPRELLKEVQVECEVENLYLYNLLCFYEDGYLQIKKMKNYIENKNFVAFLYEAHSLKGLAAGIKAKELSKKASELEIAVKEKQFDKVINEFDSLIEHYEVLLIEIKEILKEEGKLKQSVMLDQELKKEEMIDCLVEIEKALDFLEQISAEESIKKLLTYRMEESIKKQLLSIHEDIKNFEYEQACFGVKKLIDNLKE